MVGVDSRMYPGSLDFSGNGWRCPRLVAWTRRSFPEAFQFFSGCFQAVHAGVFRWFRALQPPQPVSDFAPTMDPSPAEHSPRRRYRWPWFVLGFFLLGVVLAVFTMAREVQRVKEQRAPWLESGRTTNAFQARTPKWHRAAQKARSLQAASTFAASTEPERTKPHVR